MKTILERLEAVADKFNRRAERAREMPRKRESDIAYLHELAIYRFDETTDDGEPTGFSRIHAEFDFFRSGRDHLETYAAFEREIERLGLRLVPNGDQTTMVGGGDTYIVEI